MITLRRASGALAALALFELLAVLVGGGLSLLAPPGPVTVAGLSWRLAAFGALLVIRFRLLAEDALRVSRARLLLLLLLLPALAQFHFAGGRLSGDGVMYYVYVRSLAKDLDLDFTNEYTHYGLIERGDLAVPTSTGMRRSIFAVGPGLLALPGFLAGELVARAERALYGAADLSGYGPAHRNGVALLNLLYGFTGLLLVHALLLRHFGAGVALGATLLLWGGSFLHWYLVQQPVMSHAPSAFMAALSLFCWDRWRGALGTRRAAGLGLLLGLSMCVRWQNGVLLLLPGLDLLGELRRRPRPALRTAVLLGLAALAGAFPQLLAWKVLYGEFLLAAPPHGADFVRLDRPFLMETFFSSRHGLLSWTPALWAGYLGFLPLWRRRRSLALALLPPLLAMSYLNACSGDWWAGGSFSNRRFDPLLPLLAVGFAGSIEALRRLVAAFPAAPLGGFAVGVVAWNLALAEQTARGMIPRDDTVAFQRLAGNAARVVSDAVGFPTTWPASWLFAARHGLSPGRYDLASGRYLFYRQNNMRGTIDLADADHEPLLVEGWGRIESFGGGAGRRVAREARLLAPLDVPEPLELRIRALAPEATADAEIAINGETAGRFTVAGGQWQEARLAAPAALWRRELNEVRLRVSGGPLAVSSLRFARSGR